MNNQHYELRIRKTPDSPVTLAMWTGTSGPDACQRYADAHDGHEVYAWRTPRTHLAIGVDPSQIVG